MRIASASLLVAFLALAASTKQKSGDDDIITIDPISGTPTTTTTGGVGTATETATITIPIVTTITIGVPTVISTTVAPPTPTVTSPANSVDVPAKVLVALGGGVIALAQFL